MIAEEIEDIEIKKAHKQLNECDCDGKPSLPWAYCADCIKARLFLDSLMREDYQEEDYDESRD